MKHRIALIALAFAVSAHAEDKGFGPQWLDNPIAPMGSSVPTDLDLDPAFSSDGIQIADFNNAQGNEDRALRVFTAASGYWVAGVHRSPSIVNDGIAITRLTASGALDTSYNGTGKKTLVTPIYQITDVAKGTFDTLFFAGLLKRQDANDWDYGVYCVDSTGTPCSGFGTNGLVSYAIDIGPGAAYWDDSVQRIVAYASSLYVVGSSESGNATSPADTSITMIKLSQTTGAQDISFGNTSGRPGLFSWNPNFANGNSVDLPYDLIAFAPQPFQTRLVLVGEAAATNPDTDSFIARIDGATGQFDTTFSGDGYRRYYYDLGGTNADGARRVTRQANGMFAVAGYAVSQSQAGTPLYNLTLNRFTVNGDLELSVGSNGYYHSNFLSKNSIPFGIVERPGNRDLIVGMNLTADLFGGDGHYYQGYAVLSASGNVLHSLNSVDLQGSTASDRVSYADDLILDGSRVVSAGHYLWSRGAIDYDMTIARFLPNDSIFASQFGGTTSD